MGLKLLLNDESLGILFYPNHWIPSAAGGFNYSESNTPIFDGTFRQKSFEFGKGTATDRPNGGFSGEPFIQSPIQDLGTSHFGTFTDGFIRGGALTHATRLAKDTERIGKWMITPKGLSFIAKQVGLQLTNPKLNEPVGAKIANQRTYNLGVNTLASVATAGTGLYIKREGFLPTAFKGYKEAMALEAEVGNSANRLVAHTHAHIIDYNQEVQKRQSLLGDQLGEEKSLWQLLKDDVKQARVWFQKVLGVKHDGEDLYKYNGGPGSIFGIGKTHIKKYKPYVKDAGGTTDSYRFKIGGPEGAPFIKGQWTPSPHSPEHTYSFGASFGLAEDKEFTKYTGVNLTYQGQATVNRLGNYSHPNHRSFHYPEYKSGEVWDISAAKSEGERLSLNTRNRVGTPDFIPGGQWILTNERLISDNAFFKDADYTLFKGTKTPLSNLAISAANAIPDPRAPGGNWMNSYSMDVADLSDDDKDKLSNPYAGILLDPNNQDKLDNSYWKSLKGFSYPGQASFHQGGGEFESHWVKAATNEWQINKARSILTFDENNEPVSTNLSLYVGSTYNRIHAIGDDGKGYNEYQKKRRINPIINDQTLAMLGTYEEMQEVIDKDLDWGSGQSSPETKIHQGILQNKHQKKVNIGFSPTTTRIGYDPRKGAGSPYLKLPDNMLSMEETTDATTGEPKMALSMDFGNMPLFHQRGWTEKGVINPDVLDSSGEIAEERYSQKTDKAVFVQHDDYSATYNPRYAVSTLDIQDFRKLKKAGLADLSNSEVAKSGSIEATDYQTDTNLGRKYYRESRVNTGHPGRKLDGIVGTDIFGEPTDTYNIYDDLSIDRINALDIFRSTGGNLDSHKESRDLVRFRIEALDGDDPSKADVMVFRAFLDSLGDNYTGGWKGFQYNGRAESFYTYDKFDRKINFAFKVAAQSRHEMVPLYRKLNYLVSQTAPDYSGTRMRGSFCRLTIGALIDRTPGFFTSISLKWNKQYPWDISISHLEGGADKDGASVMPHILDVNCQFTPIHNFIPKKSITDSPFILSHNNNRGSLPKQRQWYRYGAASSQEKAYLRHKTQLK
tara:strand:+ start:5182 stop:8376 length:3195 start_codon:yes stop_codon:yes gene_type:complete